MKVKTKEILRKVYRSVVSNYYLKLFGNELKKCNSVLDLGCGFKSPIMNFPKTFYAVGVEIHKPYIKISKQKKIHDKYYHLDVLDAGRKFGPKSFDCVIALGVIEHLSKKEGFKLLEIMEKLARKSIIIFTPNDFLKSHKRHAQKGYDHKSGWKAEEFKKLGYTVYGVNGLK